MKSEKFPRVQINELTKRHGDTLAVDRLSFEVKSDEFFSILGPSGSGKTTTLRLIAGLLQPDEGDIVIDGQSMKGLPPNQRPVNTVFQEYALFPHLTVWNNVAFGLRMQGVARSEITARVGEVLEIVHLPGKADRLPSALSGGEQQRVALARALVNRPSVILLDEPLGALDQQLRQEMQRELKVIQAQVGITFICVTHHQSEALLMSNRVAVMHEGRLMQIGEPEEVYAQPRCLFVAQFVGQSNRLDGEVLATNETHSVFQSVGLQPIHIPRVSQGMTGNRVVMILRPEQLTLSREHECGPAENSLGVEIDEAFYLGEEMQYVVTAPNLSWTVRMAPQHDRNARFRPGEKAFIRWEAQHGLIFPRNSDG
ncbi:MAG: ABC transporter ATP-binding protein [Bacteroidetes bacterium]|nr:ABC transporter ATP-binding protein [Bacteroidota bacterium]